MRVYNRKSVQLPYGFYTHHLDRMTQAISSEYAQQVLNISHSRCQCNQLCTQGRLFTAVFSQLSIFTAGCLRHPIHADGGCRNHMGVAHSSCYELLVLGNMTNIHWLSLFYGMEQNSSVTLFHRVESATDLLFCFSTRCMHACKTRILECLEQCDRTIPVYSVK